MQLSNEVLGAGTLCSDGLDDGDAGMDLANANNSQYLYQLKGVDGLCGTVDDVYKMVRLGMTASDTPITAKKPVKRSSLPFRPSMTIRNLEARSA